MAELILQGYRVVIHFRNNTELVLDRKKSDSGLLVNYLTSAEVTERMYAPNQNPVGAVGSGTFKLEITSSDRSLIPENSASAYYGLMDKTAEVSISFYEGETINKVDMGRFYVSTWESKTDSSGKYQVTIEGTDLIGILLKNEVPGMDIKKDVYVSDFLEDLKNALDEELEDKFKFNWVYKDIFLDYDRIDNNDIDAQSVGSLLNILNQSTLINMYISRSMVENNRNIIVANCKDVLMPTPYRLSDDSEITYANISKGALIGYSGVKVNYSIGSINQSGNLANLSSMSLVPGDNTISDISIGTAVYKVLDIGIKTDSDELPSIVSVRYNRRSATIVINNHKSSNINVEISISGQTLNENMLSVKKMSDVESNEVFEVTNSLLPSNRIDSFANGLLGLMGERATGLIIRGQFNPKDLKLNTAVNVDCSRSVYTSGLYRAHELNWKLGVGLTCEAKMIK